jgi:catechol 2,3-dioxygenase
MEKNMNTTAQFQTLAPYVIHPATRMGHVHLTVADLERQIQFYTSVVGLQLHWHEDSSAGLGAGREDLLRLVQDRAARRAHGTTGLYHFAILQPNQRELARVIGRLYSLRYRNYPTDHIMTKTTYLDDPEGNNIEIYADSPEDGTMEVSGDEMISRRTSGELSNGREALDVDKLMTHLVAGDRLEDPMPPQTRIGHVHLYVANLENTMEFYHDLLGFDNMGIAHSFQMGMASIAHYHHNIGFNTWVGAGAPPPPPNSLGLRHFSVVLPSESELEKVLARVRAVGIAQEPQPEGMLIRDPSRNGVLLMA